MHSPLQHWTKHEDVTTETGNVDVYIHKANGPDPKGQETEDSGICKDPPVEDFNIIQGHSLGTNWIGHARM